jgi:hypothetical protein
MKHMKFFIYYTLTVLFCISFVACEIDNYEEPDATIQGTIYDNQTNAPLQVDHGSGIIRMREASWAKDDNAFIGNQTLKVQQDGTYRNTKWFSGEYLMLPYSGAFYPYDDENKDYDNAGELVKIAGVTSKDFTVTPYLSVEWVEEPTVLPDNSIRCSARFKRNQKPGYEMPDVREADLLVSKIINTGAKDSNLFPNKVVLTNDMEGQAIVFTSKPVKYTGIDYYIRISMNCKTAVGKPETNYPGMGASNFTTIKKVHIP